MLQWYNICALVDFSVCINLYQVFLAPLPGNGCWVNFEPRLSLYYTFIFSFILFTMDLESTPIYQYGAPTSTILQPKESSKPILPGYELRSCLVNMVQDQPFSSEDDENPYSHLNEFEQTCSCLCIVGMSDKTLRRKLFPFSLMEKAKCWYNLTIRSRQEDWEALCSSFC